MKILVILGFITVFHQAAAQKNENIGNISYESECMGVELDGSVTLKAWGNGRNYLDASEQAKKNAVRDVVFVGIKKGSSECNSFPLLKNQSAKFDNEDYFNVFFADGGKYSQFVSMKDERVMEKVKRDKKKNGETRTHGLVVRVNRSALKQELTKDGIIK
jgi:hypothetical protein